MQEGFPAGTLSYIGLKIKKNSSKKFEIGQNPKLANHLAKMKFTTLHKVITFFIAAVWIANGLFCKILNLVPRHQQIVARILGENYARPFTTIIGISELIMACWILCGYKSRLNAFTQIVVVAVMNIIEFNLAPDLLLFGKYNVAFASLFVCVIFYNEFYVNTKKVNQPT